METRSRKTISRKEEEKALHALDTPRRKMAHPPTPRATPERTPHRPRGRLKKLSSPFVATAAHMPTPSPSPPMHNGEKRGPDDMESWVSRTEELTGTLTKVAKKRKSVAFAKIVGDVEMQSQYEATGVNVPTPLPSGKKRKNRALDDANGCKPPAKGSTAKPARSSIKRRFVVISTEADERSNPESGPSQFREYSTPKNASVPAAAGPSSKARKLYERPLLEHPEPTPEQQLEQELVDDLVKRSGLSEQLPTEARSALSYVAGQASDFMEMNDELVNPSLDSAPKDRDPAPTSKLRKHKRKPTSYHIDAPFEASSSDEMDLSTETLRHDGRTPMPEFDASDVEIRDLLRELKCLTWQWTNAYYNHHNTDYPIRSSKSSSSDSSSACETTHKSSDITAKDLIYLVHASPQLMEYVNYISACTNLAWEDLFNKRRVWLVYCIIGKVFDVHIFGCEFFGATPDQKQQLQEMDFQMLNNDGFTRQRYRSHTIHTFASNTTTHSQTIDKAVTTLCTSLLLLNPLSPSPIPQPLTEHLLGLISLAADLALAIRTHPHTIYYWQPHPTVGTEFEETEMHVLNSQEAYAAREEVGMGGADVGVEVVTMAGWPALLAHHRPFSRSERDDKASRYPVLLCKAEVVVAWGAPGNPCRDNWLGPRLRVEMADRLQRAGWIRRDGVAVACVGGVALVLAMGFGVEAIVLVGKEVVRMGREVVVLGQRVLVAGR